MHRAERADGRIEGVEIVRRLEINDSRRGIDPVDPRLALKVRVRAAYDAFRDARGQQLCGDRVPLRRAGQLLNERGVGVAEYRLALALGPFSEGLGLRAERLAFNEMYDWVRRNARKEGIGAVLAHKLDRVCRNMRDAVRMQELEDKAGVKLSFVDNQFGPGAARASRSSTARRCRTS